MNRNQKKIAFLAFAMYFITGASVIVVGCSLPHLMARYGKEVSQVVMLGSAFALGRVLTAYQLGKMIQKHGPLKVLVLGVSCLTLFILGLTFIPNYYVGLVCAFLGGVGLCVCLLVCVCVGMCVCFPLFINTASCLCLYEW